MKTKTKIMDNDTFVRENFEKLVDTYGGQTIVINGGEIFTGKNASQEARRRFPNSLPLIFPIPRPQFFSHHFLL